MTLADVQLQVQIPREIIQYWGWFLAFGIGLLVLGITAVVRSVAATVVSMLFFGWLLVLASGIEIAQAVMVGHWAGFFHHLLAAILFGVAGLMLVTRPMISAEVADRLHGHVLPGRRAVSDHSARWLSRSRAGVGRRLDGLITLVLGLLVFGQWPASGFWVIGLFIGID